MKVFLVVPDGIYRAGLVVPVPGPKFVIGRDPACELRATSEAVSRRHCEITVGLRDVRIRDLGSTNGTVVNGQILKNEGTVIRHGDRLQVGPLEFVLRVVVAAPAKPGAVEEPQEPTAVSPTLQLPPVPSPKSAISIEKPADALPVSVPTILPALNLTLENSGVRSAAVEAPRTLKSPPAELEPAPKSGATSDTVASGLPSAGTDLDMPALPKERSSPDIPMKPKSKPSLDLDGASKAALDILKKMKKQSANPPPSETT